MTNYKIGDRYVDGEYTYEVIKVYENGTCEAQRVDIKKASIPEKKAEPIVEEKAEEPEYSKTQINRLPNAELEKLCKKMGLEVGTGTEMKRALIAKLGL